jgi:hypothetical protein
MSSVSRPGRGDREKRIHDGCHDEHQPDNADDADNTPAPQGNLGNAIVRFCRLKASGWT